MPCENINLKHISLSEAAKLIGKTKRQIQYLVDRKRLAAIRDGGRWLVSAQARLRSPVCHKIYSEFRSS